MDIETKAKILAGSFCVKKQGELTEDFEAFVSWMHQRERSAQLIWWWKDMDALRVLRRANHFIQCFEQPTNHGILEWLEN